MIDENGITSSKTKSEIVDVDVGQMVYFCFEMQGLPLNGGDIYVEFYF